MNQTALMAISPLDGRYQHHTKSLNQFVSEYALIQYRLSIEIRWLQLLEANLPNFPIQPPASTQCLDEIVQNFSIKEAMRVKQIESRIHHDVKAVEYFLKEQMTTQYPMLKSAREFIHFGCTSEDINNLAYGLMLTTVRSVCLIPTLEILFNQLTQLAHQHAHCSMLARTHGQPATPTTLGKEIANVAYRLQHQIQQFNNIPIMGKLNGATGNYNALIFAYPTLNWPELSQKFVTSLGLTWNPYTTQIEPHDTLSELFAALLRINTILIDFNRDIWGYLSIHYFTQTPLEQEVGSSTMPHKINPIHFENAEGNLGLANALLTYMMTKLPISRWQRDLSDSTVLRNIGVVLGHSLFAYQSTIQGMSQLTPNFRAIQDDLNRHWEILAEAIQTLMRRYACKQPYETLKKMTRGKPFDQETFLQLIQTLDLPEPVRDQLLQLTPHNYIGYAAMLAEKV